MPRHVLSKERIIAAGVEIIDAGQALNFAAVARQLGTRSQALYAYFANQTDLSYAIVQQVIVQLTQRLQTQLFGAAGRAGIIMLAQTWRRLALDHVNLSLFVLTMPRTEAYPELTQVYDQFATLLSQMVASAYPDERQCRLLARNVRDLVVGDVVNVGSGWFSNPEIDPDVSFRENLSNSLP